MASILDTAPYPWPDPLARQLHMTLVRLHPTQDQAVFMAQKSNIQRWELDTQKTPELLWRDILDLSANRVGTRDLVAAARERLDPKQPEHGFFGDLLDDLRPPIDAQPADAVDDTVSEPEALLFRDDLTLETGRLPAFIRTLQTLHTLVPAVCQVKAQFVPDADVGSGFRVGPDLVLTNWHVLHNKSGMRPSSVTLTFGFEDDGQGGTVASVAVPADPSSIVGSSVDDWAVIKATASIDDRFLVIDPLTAAEPVIGEAAFIIQHPGGGTKRLGFVRNQVSDFDDRGLRYLTDTQPGSSGSPVFNADGRLIGLHRAGGMPQTETGKVPIVKNHGVRIPRVVAGLKEAGLLGAAAGDDLLRP